MWIWISRVLRAMIGVIAIVVAFALFGYLAENRAAPTQHQHASALPIARAIRVETAPVAMRWTGYGTARALDASDVAAEVAGRVIEQPQGLEAGVTVEEGDLLARLDPRDYQARAEAARRQADSFDAQLSALEIEEARLREQTELLAEEIEVAERDLERARVTLQSGAGNASSVDARLQAVKSLVRSRAVLMSQLEVIPARRSQLEASLDAARADQNLADDNLSRTEVRAPFGGVLQSIDVELGEWARVGDTIARVVDLAVIEVPLRMPQSALGRLAVGDRVDLTAEGPLDLAWAGSIARIAPESDASTRSGTVFVEVRQRPEPDARSLLRPGQFVMGAVESSGTRSSLVLPRRSVNAGLVLAARPWREGDPELPEGARAPMVVREAEVAVSRSLEGRFPTIDPQETQWVVVTSQEGPRGIQPGDVVLTSNLDTLRAGDMIEIRIGDEATGEGDDRAAAGDRSSETQPEGTP